MCIKLCEGLQKICSHIIRDYQHVSIQQGKLRLHKQLKFWHFLPLNCFTLQPYIYFNFVFLDVMCLLNFRHHISFYIEYIKYVHVYCMNIHGFVHVINHGYRSCACMNGSYSSSKKQHPETKTPCERKKCVLCSTVL